MEGAYLGPEYPRFAIESALDSFKAVSKYYEDTDKLCGTVAELIEQGIS